LSDKTATVTVHMNYPGLEISKNHLWKGGNRRWGMNPTAKRWKQSLAEGVRLSLMALHVFEPKAPVHVDVSGRFVDRNNAPDLHNLSELVCDAVQDGTGIEDQYFTFATTQPEYAKAMPEITVKVTVTL
jgi:hypothetical protein